jgi:dipeptide/tripeptide permease
VRLASTSINVYIAVYQICALPGGYLADRVLGNFKTQVASNFVTSLGICLVLFSSWQYTQNPPACCHWPPDPHNTSSTAFPAASPGSSGGSNCSAIHVDTVVDGVNFHLPPNLNLTLAILGLMLFAAGYGSTNAIQSVFVADQFPEGKSKAKERSFSWYYLFCNVGTLGGELGMPVLRQSVGFVISWITVLGILPLDITIHKVPLRNILQMAH